jgi:hypothetical protein
MGLSDGVVRPGALRSSGDGLELAVRIGWYRSLPLSSVQVQSLTLDGKPVPAEDITFALDGTDYRLDELAGHWDRWWFVRDPAILRLRSVSAEPGSRVHVELKIGWRIPYIIIGPQTALIQRARVDTDLEVAA